MATTLVDSVVHWRKKLDRNLDNDTILNVIHKLSKIPITLEILEVTHIGKTIRKLSKRDDIVGEKALAVLKKWRDAFASAEESVDRNSKPSSVSKKENINKKSKSPGNHDASYEKSHHKERSNHAYSHKHEIDSFSHSSSQQATLTDVSKDSPKNNVNFTSIYTYTKKDIQAKYTDYDPHADASEGYNPECPELFPSEKFRKTKKEDLVEACELKPSLKHKVKSEEQTGSLSKSKKIKTENYSNVDCSDKSKKSQDKTEKNCKKKSSIKIKSESGEAMRKKQLNMELSSDTKKSKSKKCDGNSNEKPNKSKAKVKINCSEEFTSSEVRFEDCLGFNDIVTLKKKKSSKSVQSTDKKVTTTKDNKNSRKPITSSSDHRVKTKNSEESSPSSKIKMHVNVPKPASVEVDIFSTFPEPLPNYQPLPQRNLDFYSPKKKEVLTNEDAIRFTSSRREKTAVYSGRKSFFAEVPSLFECCTRVLIEHIDAIEYMGEVPYFILKPVLERCTPNQLFNIENYNPHLLDSTNELWKIHCKRDYKLLSPDENETWRDLYLRAHDEREKKLKNLTANISASMSKSNPVRQVKLAFVDSIAKPPRDVARRQAKNGTAHPVKQPVKSGPSPKVTPKPATISISAPTSSGNTIIAPKKPKVAPLMAKTLKSMKQCFRR